MGAKLTAEQVLEKLQSLGTGITLASPFINTSAKTLFSCLHGHTWETKAGAVIYGLRGCPHCANHFALTNETIQKRLDEQGKGLRIIGTPKNLNSKTAFACAQGHEWIAVPNSVLRGNGCPHCAKRIRLTADEVQQRLTEQGKGIKLISPLGKNNHAKVAFSCSEGHVWEAILSNVLRGKGCPHCAEKGVFSKTNVRVYVMLYGNTGLTKIGISVNPEQRLATLKNSAAQHIFLHSVFAFGEGAGTDVHLIEQQIHSHFAQKHAGLKGFDGATEIFAILPQEAADFIKTLGGVDIWVDEFEEVMEPNGELSKETAN
ncbi:GIY-YIG nuclease family protein [Salmonella enterica]|nr:GIY-YIG nuclease family protein [Salmonella enterica]